MKLKTLLCASVCTALLGCSGNHGSGAPAVSETADTAKPQASSVGKEISILVLDDSGVASVRAVPTPVYQRQLEKLLPATEAAVIPAASSASENSHWGLRTVVVGIGMKLGLGGSVIGWSGSAGMRMAFSNQAKPAIP
jgi:hypothetical protein